MDKPTFEELPALVAELSRKIDILLAERSNARIDEDRLMTLDELVQYLPGSPAAQTIYDKVHKHIIPFEKIHSRLFFRKSSIDNWLANGRQMK